MPATSDSRGGSLFVRGAVWGGVIIAFCAALGFGVWWYRESRLLAAIEAAERELDESDPGWRLDDLFAARPDVPDGENSALIIQRIADAIPGGWPRDDAMTLLGEDGAEPNTLLAGKQMKAVEAALVPVAQLRQAARELSKYPRGRFAYPLSRNPRAEPLDHGYAVRRAATILALDAHALAQRGDIGEALISIRAAIHAARSLEAEPWLITHLACCGVIRGAISQAERVLAQGEATDAQLGALQVTLSPLTKSTSHVLVARGERAALHRLYEGLAGKEFTPEEVDITFDPESYVGKLIRASEVVGRAREFHPAHLRFMTRVVDAAKLPADQQAAAENALEQEDRSGRVKDPLRFFLTPNFPKVGRAARQALAAARALHALAGCERFRLGNGEWPARLENLVPAYLPEVPTDPFDGKPMRYRRWADGVVVYSVGEDRADDGGDVAAAPAAGDPFKDLGFRLWDVEKRRRPAPLPPKDDP